MSDTVYIAVAEGDNEYGECRDSIERIRKRPGDEGPIFGRGTKGYETRGHLVKTFLESRHGAILMLDGDMTFPTDTLERLRSHNLPYVSGLYMRRNLGPVAPVWFEPFSGSWPLRPWLTPIQPGRLYELGATGWGCVYIRREVFEAMRPLLKGEAFVLEDDMDLWPYDLPAIMQALKGLRTVIHDQYASQFSRQDAAGYLAALEREIKPLHGSKHDCIGSDIRFPFYARQAGYILYGDPDVSCGHDMHYAVSALDYVNQGEDYLNRARAAQQPYLDEERERVRRALEVLDE